MNQTSKHVHSQKVLDALAYLKEPSRLARIKKANEQVFNTVIQGHPYLVGFDQAINVVPNLGKKMILHAGPPVKWENMCGAMQGGISAVIIFEGWADTIEDAYKLAASGEITFKPCHELGAVGSMAGIMSPSMYVCVVENVTHNIRSYITLSEQAQVNIRMGGNSPAVLENVRWMNAVLGPMLKEAMGIAKKIDLRLLLSTILHMGDEAHNRNVAGTVALLQALLPFIMQTKFSNSDKKAVIDFINRNGYFSGPFWMAACKSVLEAGHNVKDATVLTTMCRNGYEFGIRVSNFPGYHWFTGPSQVVNGPLFAGFKNEDKGLDIGDSAITETYGLGGFAMAAAPAIVSFVGGDFETAYDYSKKMELITTGLNPNITIPILNFRGLATSIDVMKVVEHNMLPIINTAIAHKNPGVGMIGAGIVNPPWEVFEKAIVALAADIK